jgi:hypothetical protein
MRVQNREYGKPRMMIMEKKQEASMGIDACFV